MQLVTSRFLITILFSTLMTGCGSSVQSPQPLSQPLAQVKNEDISTIARRITWVLKKEYPYASEDIIERITQHEIQKRSNIQEDTLSKNLEEQMRESIKKEFLEIMQYEMENASNLASSYATEPVDFKGIKLGSDINELSRSMYNCNGYLDEEIGVISDKRCTSKNKETIANSPVQSIMYLYYYNKLHRIWIEFDEPYFRMIIAALIEKNGQGEYKTETVQNRAGASFENKIYRWKRGDITIEATRYSGTIAKSTVTYYTSYYSMEFQRRIAEKGKKGVKDL